MIAPRHSARCGACSAQYESHEWEALPVVRVMGGDDLHDCVLSWPSGDRIEVRTCRQCNRSIARIVRSEPVVAPSGPRGPVAEVRERPR